MTSEDSVVHTYSTISGGSWITITVSVQVIQIREKGMYGGSNFRPNLTLGRSNNCKCNFQGPTSTRS